MGYLSLEDRSNSRANLEKIPVTMDDPLGALSSQNSPMATPAKEKAVSTFFIDLRFLKLLSMRNV